MPSNDSSTAETHKWKACLGCGHPQHSRECREMVMPGLPGDLDECGCVELTNINDIIDLCRRSGGCPKHPIPEPPGSASSSPDEPVTIPCGACKSYLLNACKAFEKCIVAHTPPADAETAEEPECPPACAEAHTYNKGCALRAVSAEQCDCDCHACDDSPCDDCTGAEDSEPEAPECSHESWDKFSSTAKCVDCGHTWTVEPPKCPEVAITGEHCQYEDGGPCCFCGTEPEPEAPECKHETQGPWRVKSTEGFGEAARTCKDCGVTVVYSGLSNPECSACGGWDSECPGHGAKPLSRPPNAVAYATEGGAQFEIALSGDATVRAIDGALIITHAGAVLAITQVRPMET